ncbi:MAG TPA: alpha/beta hydrolase [Verrucomicrobiae bacterium]|nr:alpha/beta hydrolase [Verrucomicrobiae bacterium]
MNVVVNKLLTNYSLSGKGKLVLLLHGWGDSAKGLAVLHKQLAKDYRVLSLDLPGFGGTQAPLTPWNLDDYAGFVQSVLKKLDLPQPYAVVGHSNGGALAVRATSLGLLEPNKLVLLASSGIRGGRSVRRIGLKVLTKVGNAATIWLPERYRRNLRESLYTTVGSDMLAVPEMRETFQQVVRQDIQADAANITQPTLLVYAEDDPAVPPSDGRVFQRLIKDSRLETVPGGHFVHLEQPERVAQLIREFLT